MSLVGQWHALPRRSIAVRFTSISRSRQDWFNATLCAPGANIAAPLMSNACEGNSAVAALSQNLPNLREKLTRAVRLRYKIIAARCSGFLFISAQGICRDRDNRHWA